ncbi:MAG: YbhN family protein [Nitrososphaerales archaeon]
MARLTTKVLFLIILAIGVYTAFLIFSDISLLTTKFQNFNALYLPLAFLLVLASYIVRGMRWDMFLKILKIEIPMKKSFLIFFAGMALGITPGKFGEVIKSHFLKRDFSQSVSKTAPIVFIERFYDLVGIAIISIFGLWLVDIGRIPLFIALILMVAALVISQQRRLLIPLLKKFENISILKRLGNLSESYGTIQVLLSPTVYAKGAGYSVAAWIIESIAVYFVFRGFEIDLSFPVILLIFTTSSIIGAASMLPGGIGITEGGMVGLLSLQGLDYTTAFTTVLMVRIVTLWYSVIIGLIALRMASKTEKN